MAEVLQKNSHSGQDRDLVNSTSNARVAEGAPPKRHIVNQSPTRDLREGEDQSLVTSTSTRNEEVGYNSKVEGDVIVTKTDAVLNWFKKNSLWPMPMGLACCAIELMATG